MISVREIIAITALNFGIEPVEVIADNRQADVALCRHVAMYVARKMTEHATTVIATAFRRDHTTVIYGIDRIETELKAAPGGKLAALVESLKTNIEFRRLIEARGGVNVLKVARHIAAKPLNRAISASVMEVAALAATVLDLWEIAVTAEALAEANCDRRELRGRGLVNLGDREMDELDQVEAREASLGRAILEELAAMRGDEPITEQEEVNG